MSVSLGPLQFGVSVGGVHIGWLTFAASGMKARQGGDVEQAPSRSDDSPPGRPNNTGTLSTGGKK